MIIRTKSEESGITLVEYILLASILAVLVIVSLRLLGQNTGDRFCQVAGNVGQGRDDFRLIGGSCGVGGWP